LIRGKIDMIAGARIWHVDPLIRANRYFVLKQAIPRVHVLQFNPQSEPLRNREFRRALEHSINKQQILRQDILQGANSKHGRLITAPYDRRNYAYNTLIQPRPYDLNLAVALRLASQKALGGEIPTLRMVCDPDPPIMAAAHKMIAEWKRVGIPVRLLNNTGQVLDRDSADWDIVYRTGTMPEPLNDLWPFLTMSPRAEIADLDHLPDWLRQELIALDTAIDWKSAIEQLKRLHRLLSAEVQLIPLWEVDEYSVYRRHLEGYQTNAVQAYQNIDRWTVDAWIPPETP
jgi:ABC-type oligopeptide transport system substrate-binding subunit